MEFRVSIDADRMECIEKLPWQIHHNLVGVQAKFILI